jgi:hypothetical protein
MEEAGCGGAGQPLPPLPVQVVLTFLLGTFSAPLLSLLLFLGSGAPDPWIGAQLPCLLHSMARRGVDIEGQGGTGLPLDSIRRFLLANFRVPRRWAVARLGRMWTADKWHEATHCLASGVGHGEEAWAAAIGMSTPVPVYQLLQ